MQQNKKYVQKYSGKGITVGPAGNM